MHACICFHADYAILATRHALSASFESRSSPHVVARTLQKCMHVFVRMHASTDDAFVKIMKCMHACFLRTRKHAFVKIVTPFHTRRRARPRAGILMQPTSRSFIGGVTPILTCRTPLTLYRVCVYMRVCMCVYMYVCAYAYACACVRVYVRSLQFTPGHAI